MGSKNSWFCSIFRIGFLTLAGTGRAWIQCRWVVWSVKGLLKLKFPAKTCWFGFWSPKGEAREIAILMILILKTLKMAISPRVTILLAETKPARIFWKFQLEQTFDTSAYPSTLNSCPASPGQGQKPHTENWAKSWIFGAHFLQENNGIFKKRFYTARKFGFPRFYQACQKCNKLRTSTWNPGFESA